QAQAARPLSPGYRLVGVYDPTLRGGVVDREELEHDIGDALGRNELRVSFRPVCSLQTGELVELETVVAWQHPTRGLLSSADFAQVARDTGRAVPIGRYVIEKACTEAAARMAEGV